MIDLERQLEIHVCQEILENRLDFLLHSLRPLLDRAQGAEEEVLPKCLVLNLAAATEMILKARLCKEHWSLIFQKPVTVPPQRLAFPAPPWAPRDGKSPLRPCDLNLLRSAAAPTLAAAPRSSNSE